MKNSAIGLILQAGPLVKVVLLVLFFFSVVSWAIILYKWKYFAKARKENAVFFKSFMISKEPSGLYHAAKGMVASPLASVFRSVYADAKKGHGDVKRSLKRFIALEASKLEKYLNFLATTGSTTPFIGLFGTVWGIMNSFRGIGSAGSASLSVVAPGIAEALIATAAGLVAAIPAVIGYNYYLSMSRRFIIEMEDFGEELTEYFTRRNQ